MLNQIKNTSQIETECKLHLTTLSPDKLEMAQHYFDHFRNVNFPKWIHILEEVRQTEIRYHAKMDMEYNPATFEEYDEIIQFFQGEQEEFESYRKAVLKVA